VKRLFPETKSCGCSVELGEGCSENVKVAIRPGSSGKENLVIPEREQVFTLLHSRTKTDNTVVTKEQRAQGYS
jgi:hypothetical protein